MGEPSSRRRKLTRPLLTSLSWLTRVVDGRAARLQLNPVPGAQLRPFLVPQAGEEEANEAPQAAASMEPLNSASVSAARRIGGSAGFSGVGDLGQASLSSLEGMIDEAGS